MTNMNQVPQREKDLLAKLPKIDLHVHLDGSVKPETIKELALSQLKPLHISSDAELLSAMKVHEQCESLKEYLEKFSFVLPYLQTAEALERVAYELVEQAAKEQVKYVEVRFAPQLHREEGLSVEEVIAHTIRGLERGEQAFGTIARAIIICLRSHSMELNKEIIAAAAPFYKKGVVAVDLAGDEASFPANLFREMFQEAGRLGLPVTIHAGEAAGAESVHEAIHGLGAVRIGHGVRIQEDAAVVALVKEKQIPLEMCPLSNIQTKAVSDWAAYPIRQYLEDGIIVTVNTDNMTVSDTTITKEYELLMEHCGFTLNEVVVVIMNGVDAAFLEDEEKTKLKQQFLAEFSALGISVIG